MSVRAAALDRLRAATWLKSAAIRKIFDILGGAQGQTRAVGGAVRDTLLGLERDHVEVDLATELVPQEVIARARAAGLSAVPTGIDFGTVTVVVAGQGVEVTTLRRDVETDGRRAIVAFGTDWALDAARRDFTLNALYCGPDGALFDPLGGLADCLARQVRFIGDADARINEDRLRVYRFFRFSASHGGEKFDTTGLEAARVAAGTLGNLSAERVGHEMVRILGLPKCAKTLKTMREAGILAVEDQALQRLSSYEGLSDFPRAAGRACLMHPGGGMKALKSQWRLSNAFVREMTELNEAADLLIAGDAGRAALRFRSLAVAAVALAGAKAEWSAGATERLRKKVMALDPPEFPISGLDLLDAGHEAGAALGKELSRLETLWIDSGFTMTASQLLARAERTK